ncbi:MAG: MATE family efflux transporter, partial [Candidatus Ornithospirochaeta sp.]
YYLSGRSVIKTKAKAFCPSWAFIKATASIGIPTAVIQICLSVASSLTNISSAFLPESDEIIAAYGVVQRLILIGSYMIMGFMQGYQPVASYAFGGKMKERFLESVRFAIKGALAIAFAVEVLYIALSRPLIASFNSNEVIIRYGRLLLLSQMILFPSFGLCYMMTITYQTIGCSGYGLFLSTIRQGIFYVPLILILPRLFSFLGICLSQPLSDVLTVVVCVLSVKKMKKSAEKNMEGV